MGTSIKLPVIERVVIHNFSLYPGTQNQGLDISFSNGVTVVAGINGVGKTTLLTLLLRLLVGPNDPEKASRGIGRVSKRELVHLKKYDFFSKRVPEILGPSSVATLHFSLGDKKIEVTRYMNNMALKSVRVGGRSYRYETEVGFIDYLAKQAGLTDGYDFHMVVRYLQFFGEDRLPLLWDPGSQFEFFKILFFDEAIAVSLNRAYSEIQRLDTDYRNRRHQLNNRIKSLPPEDRDSASIELEVLDRSIRAATEDYQRINVTFGEKKQEFQTLHVELMTLENRYDEGQVSLGQLEREFSEQDAAFILQALPTLDEKEKFLLQGFATGCGCFVCGAKGKKQISNINKKTRSGYCFVCDAPIKSPQSDKVTPITANKIRDTEQGITALQRELDSIEKQRLSLEKDVNSLRPLLKQASDERFSALAKLDALSSQRPTEGTVNTSVLRAEIEREEQALDFIDAARKDHVLQFRKSVDQAQGQMDLVKERLRTLLSGYASAFLQENINVEFIRQVPFKLATGADRVNIPSFKIHMTSSTHAVPHERRSSDSVSESQKEFLDLAFRMTLLDMISEDGAAMLVIETPEASLDSWFMLRAAHLMRKFAPEKETPMRKLIATSNVNGTQMIPALLGLIDKDGEVKKLQRKRASHLINLLALTPQPATLKDSNAQAMLADELGKYTYV